MSRPDYDVLVLGGGPAGTTAAALLAREGRRVALLERETGPRYHIGESLLPSVLPFLEELGVAEEVARHGFQRKLGQTFVWGRDRSPWVLDFRELDVYPYAYFVERSDFDALLLRNAARLGAEVHEGVSVEDARTDERGRVCGVRARRSATGETWSPTASLVIDATGQNALLARRSGEREYVEGLRNVAVWSYWEGAGRLPPPGDEHIITVSTESGWIWFIPMRDGRTSVGVVTSDRSALRGAGGPREDELADLYLRALRRAELIGELLSGARQVAGVRTQRDWSYCARRFYGPGFLLAGDAACFIDPILSTGVHLAMTGGYTAAVAAHSALAEPAHEPAFMRYFQRSYAATYRDLLTQVRYFYRVEAHRESVFWKSKRILRVDPRLDGSLAFLFLTSGLARHVVADAPHDLPAQAHAAFPSRLGPGDVRYRPGAASRSLSGASRLVVTDASGALLALEQEGLRLRLHPVAEAPFSERPARTAFLVEVARADGAPVGTLLCEPERPNLPRGARVVRGFAMHARAYRGHLPAGALRDAADAAALAIAGSAETDLVALESDVREALESAGGETWDLARPAPLGDPEVAAMPVVTEYTQARDGAPLWVVISTRRVPEVLENPYWRGRLADLNYTARAPSGEMPAGVLAVLDAAIAALTIAEAACSTASALLDLVVASVPPPVLGWAFTGARRIEPTAPSVASG